MKIGNQTVSGFFEFNRQLTYTEGDLVLELYTESGITQRRIYYVKSEVSAIPPHKDLAEIYYEDYFKRVYSEDDILTKSNILTYLRSLFTGINEQGKFVPEEITVARITSINTSGLWYVPATGETIVTYIGETKSFMLIYTENKVEYRLGVTSGNSVTWSDPHIVLGDSNKVVEEHISSLTALEILLRERVSQYDEIIRALS